MYKNKVSTSNIEIIDVLVKNMVFSLTSVKTNLLNISKFILKTLKIIPFGIVVSNFSTDFQQE